MRGEKVAENTTRGWWELRFTGVAELNDADREHIATLIRGGFTEGEVIHSQD